MWEGIATGLQTVMTPINLLMVFAGCVVGTFIGMLPGLGPISAIALMIPITYGLDPSSALILMAGVYYGAMYGGSTTSILINAPGEAASVATTFDGYPLAKKGFAGKALAISAYGSFAGGTIATILLMVAASVLAKVSLSFQSPEYFALMVMGLSAVAGFAGPGKFLKAIMMTVLGLMLSTIGTDKGSGIQRFTFGQIDLIDGIDFLLLAMAVFALSDTLLTVFETKPKELLEHPKIRNIGSLKLTKAEVKEVAPTILRHSFLGFFVGVLPGAGPSISSLLAYSVERAIASAKDKLMFGRGSLRGVAAPETANNAASSGSFVPMLTLGVPGSGSTALMLGALVSYGIQPGPLLYQDHPEVFWSVIVSMYLGNVILLFLNLPCIPFLARLLNVPKPMLFTLIMFFSLIGIYLVSFNNFDIQLMVLFALVSMVLRMLEFPMAPLILGFVLGGMIEENLRRALTISDGSYAFLWERPITLGIFIVTLLVLAIPIVQYALSMRKTAV